MIGLFIALITIFFHLGSKSFWIDEAFSVSISRNPDLLNYLWLHEFNMWSYYIVLHNWLNFGESEFWVRLPSAVFAIATIPFLYKTGEILFDKSIARLATIIISLNVFFLYYAKNARAYSLVLLLTVASTYYFIRLVQKNESHYKILYILASVLAVYTHIFSLLILLSQFFLILFLPFKKYLKSFGTMGITIAVLILPLSFAPSFHSHQVDWLQKSTITNIVGTYFLLSGDFIPSFLITVFLIVVFFPWRNIKNWKYTLVFILLILPVFVTFLFSVLVKPMYQSVYFIISLPALVLLVSISVQNIQNKIYRKGIIFFIIFFSLVRLLFWYTNDNRFKTILSNHNTDWRGATSYVVKHAKPGNAVIFYTYYGKTPFLLYAKSQIPEVVETTSDYYTMENGPHLPEPDLQLIHNFDYDVVWFVIDSHATEFSHVHKFEKIIEGLNKKYTLEETKEFHELTVSKYIRNN